MTSGAHALHLACAADADGITTASIVNARSHCCAAPLLKVVRNSDLMIRHTESPMKVNLPVPQFLRKDTEQPAPSDAQRTRPQDRQRGQGPLSGLSGKAPRPARVNGGIASLNIAGSSTLGPTRPDVKGAERPTPAVQATMLRPGRLAKVNQKADKGMDKLHTVDHASALVPQTPQTRAAMDSADGLHAAVVSMFGADSAAQTLAEQVLRAMPAATEGESTHKSPLVLATALHAVCGNDAAAASQLLNDAGADNPSPQLFRLQRVLAQTASGSDVLCHLSKVNDEAGRQRLCESMNICSELEAKGFALREHSSAAGVVQALAAQQGLRLDQAVGTEEDAPLQLLAKALTYAHGQGGAGQAELSPHKAAYVAWKKGGFTESGPGTDFNKSIERMHKFLTYVDRADHGARTPGVLAREIADAFPKAAGLHKSPLSATRHGTLGGDLGLLHEEAQKFERALSDAIAPVQREIERELKMPGVQQDPGRLHARLARAAVLHLWKASGRTDITLKTSDIVTLAREMQGDHGDIGRFDVAELERHLKSFTKAPMHIRGERQVKVNFKMLEEMGDKFTSRGPAGIELAHRTRAAIAQARNIKKGGEPGVPLFKASDLKTMWGDHPRPGPTAAHAQDVLGRLAQAPFESMSVYSDGAAAGLSFPGAFILNTAMKVGTPLVFPTANAQVGHNASVTVGVSNTGGRFFIGKDTTPSAEVGGGFVWGVGVPKTKLQAALIAGGSASGSMTGGEGVCITARNDAPGFEGKLKEVVDFMFEQAQPGSSPQTQPQDGPDLSDLHGAEHAERPLPGPDRRQPQATGSPAQAQAQAQAQRPQTPSELWNNFAERFGDDPAVALTWNSERTNAGGVQAGAAAAARGAENQQISIGPVLNANTRWTGSRFSRTPGAPGSDVPAQVGSGQVTAGAGASLSQTVPAQTIGEGKGGVKAWTMAVPLVGASVEFNLAGTIGVARLGRNRDGTLSPSQCHREVLFRHPNRLIEYGNSQRAEWVAAMVAQDPTGRTTEARANERYNEFLQHVKATPGGGNRLFGELKTLKPDVVDKINAYEAVLSTMLGKGDAAASGRDLTEPQRAECNRLQGEVHALLQHESSWAPGGIYAVETNFRGRNVGWDLGVKASGQQQASVNRLTALLVAGLPEPDENDPPAAPSPDPAPASRLA